MYLLNIVPLPLNLSCADGAVMPSWFDIPELPLTAVTLLVQYFLNL